MTMCRVGFVLLLVALSGLVASGTGAQPRVAGQPVSIPALDPGITWILPSEDRLMTADHSTFAALVGELQRRVGETTAP